MKPIIKKKPNQSYIARLKKDLLLLLSHLEMMEPRRREHFHRSKESFGNEFASLEFMYGEE